MTICKTKMENVKISRNDISLLSESWFQQTESARDFMVMDKIGSTAITSFLEKSFHCYLLMIASISPTLKFFF